VVGLGDRFHAAAELATGQKLAAVAASAAALAGGGTAIDEFANHQGPPLPAPVPQVEAQPVKEEVPLEPTPPPAPDAPPTEPAAEPAGPATPEQAPPQPPADPATEFAPGGAQEPDQAPPSQQQAADTFSPTSTGGSGGDSSGASGEFAP
jgi:outer membrane biosynthesis protein TonB